MKNNQRKWLERGGLLSLFLSIISFSITFTIQFRPLYHWMIAKEHLTEVSGLTEETLRYNYRLLLQFLNRPWVKELKLPDFPMSEAGLGHFYDVKALFLLNYGVLLVTIVPSVIFLYMLVKEHRQWRLVRPMQWGMLLPVGLLGVMAVGFNQFFVMFHELFFRNDDWLFDPLTDPIITVLPESFFMWCFILFFIVLEFLLFLLLRLGKRPIK
ncbi:TIGR01906 family membrane protein [Enterococcus sp. LJL98]